MLEKTALLVMGAIPSMPADVAAQAAPYLFPALAILSIGALLLSYALEEAVPDLDVKPSEFEANDEIDAPKYDAKAAKPMPGTIPCYDPGTMQFLGEASSACKEVAMSVLPFRVLQSTALDVIATQLMTK